jgi:hypothetical protein
VSGGAHRRQGRTETSGNRLVAEEQRPTPRVRAVELPRCIFGDGQGLWRYGSAS